MEVLKIKTLFFLSKMQQMCVRTKPVPPLPHGSRFIVMLSSYRRRAQWNDCMYLSYVN